MHVINSFDQIYYTSYFIIVSVYYCIIPKYISGFLCDNTRIRMYSEEFDWKATF